MEHITIIQAGTQAHFAALSRIHALSWRAAYRGVIPQAYLDREITEDRWVPFFREGFRTGAHQGLLLLADGEPVCGGSCGPARLDAGRDGSLCAFDNRAFAGWGEIVSLYTLPGETGKGYGGRLLEEMVRRLAGLGCPGCLLYVLEENPGARRFYERHGFAWDGARVEVPLPPDTVCTDLRYLRPLAGEGAP